MWPMTLTVAALIAYPVIFPEGYSSFMERWNTAHKVESPGFGEAAVFGRALFGMIDFLGIIDQVPLLGYGLGFGGNASTTLQASIDGFLPGTLAETDFTRHMVDLGPLFGVAFIGFRFVLTAWMAGQALRATRLGSDPLPFLLFSYAGLVIGTGQLTGQGTINLFGWLYAGLLLASCRGEQASSLAATVPPQPACRAGGRLMLQPQVRPALAVAARPASWPAAPRQASISRVATASASRSSDPVASRELSPFRRLQSKVFHHT
jgi:hypothetical protein